MTELSDELLVAYVDGQLARKQTRAVEAVLDQDDVLAARLDALKHAHARLEAAFEAILAGEELDVSATSVPQEEGLLVPWYTLKLSVAGLGIAAALALAVTGYGWPLSLPGLSSAPVMTLPASTATLGVTTWQDEVARAHALLGRQTLEVSLASQANYRTVAFQLSKILGVEPKVPNLDAQGFTFISTQVLQFDGEPLVQILYLGETGAPLALYAKTGEGKGSPKEGRVGTVGTVAWAQDGISYLLAGEAEEPLLMRIATRIKLEPAAPSSKADEARTPANSTLDEKR
jgi:anti-sigma factor RsiW